MALLRRLRRPPAGRRRPISRKSASTISPPLMPMRRWMRHTARVDAGFRQCFAPGQHVLVDAIDEGAIEIEEESGRAGGHVRMVAQAERPACITISGGRGALPRARGRSGRPRARAANARAARGSRRGAPARTAAPRTDERRSCD